MRAPRGYIVRIYRRGYRSLAGTVEDVQTNARHGFRTTDELLALLGVPPAGKPPPKSRTR